MDATMIANSGMQSRSRSTCTGEALMPIVGDGELRATVMVVHVGGPVQEVDHTEGQQTTRVRD
jgi:hypothetical protein